jgi:nitroreductase
VNVTDALTTRRTIRAFKPDRIDRALLVKILEPALHAPSWANTQPWEVVVAVGEPLERLRKAYAVNLKNCVPRNPDIAMPGAWSEECRMRMDALKSGRAEALEQECKDPASIPDMMQMNYRLFNAPAVVYLCMDRCLTPWSLFDLGAMSHGIMLAAEEHGIGSAVAVTLAAHPDLIRKELGIPDNLAIVIGIALGYPDPDHPQNKFRSTRRRVEEAVRFKGY